MQMRTSKQEDMWTGGRRDKKSDGWTDGQPGKQTGRLARPNYIVLLRDQDRHTVFVLDLTEPTGRPAER